MAKTCLLFIAHDEKYRDRFNKFTKDLKDIDCYFYDPDWTKIFKLYSQYAFVIKGKTRPTFDGNVTFAIFYFRRLHPEYDQYIIMEYDVNIKGYTFKEVVDYTLEQFDKGYDAILQVEPQDTKGWWWVNRKKAIFKVPSEKDMKKELLNLYALKADVLDYLKDCYVSKEYYGFFELVITTALMMSDYKICHYSDHFNVLMAWKRIGIPDTLPDYCLYHPEKDPTV